LIKSGGNSPLFYYIFYARLNLNRTEMVVELKYIIEQLNDLLNLGGVQLSVCAGVDNENIVNWCIVGKDDDGNIYPVTKMYDSIRELILERTPIECHAKFMGVEEKQLLTLPVDDLMKKRREKIKR
jgi:hypothetical protein